jgi:hypothetical protein
MNLKIPGKNRIHTVLVLFVLVNIIGDIGNVAFWHASPSFQLSIVPVAGSEVPSNGGYIYSLLGDAATTLAVGSTILTIVAVIYAVALFGLLKKKTWGALVVIGISVVNSVFAVFLYELSPAFAFWGVWTIILVVVAYLDYRKLKIEQPAKEFVISQEQTA